MYKRKCKAVYTEYLRIKFSAVFCRPGVVHNYFYRGTRKQGARSLSLLYRRLHLRLEPRLVQKAKYKWLKCLHSETL